MLAVYVSMDVLLSNLAVLGETVTKTCGVKNRTGTDDLLLRDTGNLFAGLCDPGGDRSS